MILAILAFSAAAVTLANALPFQSGNLVTPNTLNIVGSSTVGPIASEEATAFPNYWNNLVSANPSWGTASTLDINTINIQAEGSGTAIPALTGGTADIGEMSRPPQNSAAEWLAPSMTNMQIWAVGIDSVAIVVSSDMASWMPTNLNTLQVAQLFGDNNPTANIEGNGTGTTPLYSTWGQFLAAYYGGASNIPSSVPANALSETINRAVRDPTSGTFDCFNNYFAVPNGYQFEHKTSSVVDASENMAPYTYCEANINIEETVAAGNTAAGTDYIGFISLGYLESYSNVMSGLNIAFNTNNNGNAGTNTYITYYGPASTVGDQTYTWSGYVTPTRDNVIYAYSGVQGSGATGAYEAWRYLWEVTPSTIPSTGPLLATGVWIAYMRAYNTTASGASDFVNDNNYIEMSPADMTGATVLNSNLQPYTPTAGQTQTIPSGAVSSSDFFYFVDAYIHYYSSGTYNPYADITATGTINSSDFFAFVNAYIQYFISYNPS